MACYHPLKAFAVGITEKGKTRYKVVSHDVKWIRYDGSNYIKYTDGEPFGDCYTDCIDIPCGKCIGCRLEYSRQWANRCMLELQYHDSAYFVTLTYNNDHLPENLIVDMDSGEIMQSPVHTLCKRDLQLFLKRLRRYSGQEIRFFACGEYGSTTFRPHYHLIIFGLRLDDLKFLKQNFRRENYYTSDLIQKCWKNGYSLVTDVTWDTCAYVARYVTKKLTGDAASVYNTLALQAPFCNMSRRPGIARQYYDDHFDDFYRYDRITISTDTGGRSFRPPRYYDRLYDIDYPDDMAAIKNNRKFVAESIMTNKLNNTDLSEDEYRYVEEDMLLSRLGKIKERSTI